MQVAFQIKILCFKQPSIRVVSTHSLIKKIKAPFFVWVWFVARNFLGHWFSATPPWDSRKHHYLLNVSARNQNHSWLALTSLSRAEHRSPYLFCIKLWLVCWSIWICYNWAGLLLLWVLITTLKWRKRKKEASEGVGGGGGKLFFVTPWSIIFGVRESWCTEKLFRKSRFKCTPWNLNCRSSEVNEALIWPNDLN